MEQLFIKRLAFDHERETRVVIFDGDSLSGEVKKGIFVEVEPFDLLTSIWIDPRAPDEIVKAYRFYLQNELRFTGKVERSALYSVPNEVGLPT